MITQFFTGQMLFLTPNQQCRSTEGTHGNVTIYDNQQVEYRPKLEMWANAQRDGRPAEYRWRPLFNATKFG